MSPQGWDTFLPVNAPDPDHWALAVWQADVGWSTVWDPRVHQYYHVASNLYVDLPLTSVITRVVITFDTKDLEDWAPWAGAEIDLYFDDYRVGRNSVSGDEVVNTDVTRYTREYYPTLLRNTQRILFEMKKFTAIRTVTIECTYAPTATPTATPTVTPTATPTPVCLATVQTTGLNANLRLTPFDRDDNAIIGLPYGTQLILMGFADTEVPPDMVDYSTNNRWWLVTRDITSAAPYAEGWVWGDLIDGEGTAPCQLVPEVPPDEPDPPPPPDLCRIRIRDNVVSAYIQGNDLQTEVSFYAAAWQKPTGGSVTGIGSRIGVENDGTTIRNDERSLEFVVYGLNSDKTYYLISPVWQTPALWYQNQMDQIQPGFTIPANTSHVQNWVNVSNFVVVSRHPRACDFSALGLLPEYFRTTPTDDRYAISLEFYMNTFLAPLNHTLYQNETNPDLGAYYGAFRVSQRPNDGHWAQDIVYRPPDGRAGTSSTTFGVFAPAPGIVVDIGPDGITGSQEYRGPYASFPPFVLDVCPETEGYCEPTGTYLVQFYPEGDQWVLQVALSYETDGTDSTTGLNEVLNTTGAPPEGVLVDKDQRAELDAASRRLQICPGIYGCSAGPGRLLVIWHEANDGDAQADIETAYLHVTVLPQLYATWHQNCRVITDVETRVVNWEQERINPNSPCLINPQPGNAVQLGYAEELGFTTGFHLHMHVAIDGNDIDDNNVFNKPFAHPEQTGEWIDPALSIDMHMPPGEGGHD
jgi:hypothetical protein